MLRAFKPYLAAFCIIAIVFVTVSILDIIVALIFPFFNNLWQILFFFSIGGVFAAVVGFIYAIKFYTGKSTFTKWGLLCFLVTLGILSIFWLTKIDHGAFEAAFRAFGICLILGSLFFLFDNIKKASEL